MKRHFFIRWSVPTLVVATALLAGCSWFHRDRTEYYKGAAETRPLEVPPDLDTPSTTKELVVPGATAAGTAAPTAGAASMPVSGQPPAAAVTTDTNELHVADTVDSTWQRVGLALDRAQLGKITSRDETGRSYALDFSGAAEALEAAPTQEHHWYTRILHPFGGGADKKPPQIASSLRINVSEDAGGARVSVVGSADDKSAPAAVRRVIQVLRDRLS